MFDCPAFTMMITEPVAVRLLGQQVTARWVAGKISSQLPSAFYATLESYWRLIADWASSVLADLQQKFEVYAENYRANAEQVLSGRELTKEELVHLQKSLAQLKPDTEESALHRVKQPGGIPTPQEEAV